MNSFYDYEVTSDGRVFNKNGTEMYIRLHNGRYEIQLTTSHGRKTFILPRVIYSAFNIDFDIENKDLCIVPIDGNKLNVHIDNLKCVHRADLVQGSKHKNVAKLTDKQVEEIKQIYAKTSHLRNVNQKTNIKNGHSSMEMLAKKYGVTKGLIYQIVNGLTRNANNYKLKK